MMLCDTGANSKDKADRNSVNKKRNRGGMQKGQGHRLKSSAFFTTVGKGK